MQNPSSTLSASEKSTLFEILSTPASPFREDRMVSTLTGILKKHGVPHFLDAVGNIVLGAGSLAEYKRILSAGKNGPLPLFIAHMDHPGFHGARWNSTNELEIVWHGGSPTQDLQGSRVWVCSTQEGPLQGTLTQAELIPSQRAILKGVVRLEKTFSSKTSAADVYGGFGFRAPVWEENSLFYTKAADDLVGCFAIVALALRTFHKKKKTGSPSWLGLLTRAEEVGYIGAIAHLETGLLQKSKRKVICVSLETSRTLPGADIGKGPVVRLGDRTTIFDPWCTRVLADVAERALPNEHQKRVMDGGSCEATAVTAYGLPAIGISVPLGNYHNQNFEGGPDARASLGPAPEFVHSHDVARLLKLCQALVVPGTFSARPWMKKRQELQKSLRKYRLLLKKGR